MRRTFRVWIMYSYSIFLCYFNSSATRKCLVKDVLKWQSCPPRVGIDQSISLHWVLLLFGVKSLSSQPHFGISRIAFHQTKQNIIKIWVRDIHVFIENHHIYYLDDNWPTFWLGIFFLLFLELLEIFWDWSMEPLMSRVSVN